ncbi:MAG: peptide-methionine (S)-S-oxide reductase MsrA [Dongiaceae bacterium]
MLFSLFGAHKTALPAAEEALPGRAERPFKLSGKHVVSGRSILPPFPEGMELAQFGLGCFWGAERKFWQAPGVHVTAVGYSGGTTPNPTYHEVCSGQTGHTEAVLVVFDPKVTSYQALLKLFWEAHDPTQGMRQGNDIGTQYRSAIYTYSPEQKRLAEASRDAYQKRLATARLGAITTEIADAPEFYYAEEPHQQYLARNPGGYCGIGGTGVTCPIGLETAAE